MKRLLSIMFAVSLLLVITSCSNNKDSKNLSNENIAQTSSETKEIERTAIWGYSLDEVGLTATLPNDLDLGNTNAYDDKNEPLMLYGSSPYSIEDSQKQCLMGNYTEVCAVVTDLPFAVDYFSIADWQAFKKSDLEKENSAVDVRRLLLTNEQLEKYTIYEDDEIVIYDFTSMVIPLDFDSYITYRKLYAYCPDYPDKQTYDYTWVKNLHEYVAEHASEMIHKISPTE